VAGASGGAVDIYDDRGRVGRDLGLVVDTDDSKLVSQGYDPGRPIAVAGGACTVSGALAPPAFFFPSFLSRLALRVGCTTAWSARLMRWLIDQYRLRNRTAINQSAAPLGRGGRVRLTRRIEVGPHGVGVTDTLSGTPPGVKVEPLLVGTTTTVERRDCGGDIILVKRFAVTAFTPALEASP
jgi:hypothetical protein